MRQYLKPGRIIAFIMSTTLVLTVWGMIFQPGGLGSNILLGIVIGLLTIYYGTKNLGAFLDDLFFEGGSKEKAYLMRRARNELKVFRERLQKSSKKMRREKHQELEAFEKTLNELEEQTLSSRPSLQQVRKLLEKVDQTALAYLGKLPRRGAVGGFESLSFALLAAIALRILIVEPYQIPSGSMIPTLLVGDHLFVSKLSYGIMNPFSRKPSYLVRWASPEPGDVMIFEAPPYVPHNAGATWIKRVIAKAGQRVKMRESVLYIDGKPYPHTVDNRLVDYYDYYMGYAGWRKKVAFATREQIGEDVNHQIYMKNPDEGWPKADTDGLTGLTCDGESCMVQEGYVFLMGDNRGGSLDGRIFGAVPVDNIKGKALFIWMSVDGRKEWFHFGSFSMPEFRWSRWFREIR
ncbi:MAG: signal peptidase I [Deltaproteobacteria bacterium]|nr:signal peptidase I [Deltaproteobacteria bacterium]